MSLEFKIVLTFVAFVGVTWALDGYEDQYGTVEYVNIVSTNFIVFF